MEKLDVGEEAGLRFLEGALALFEGFVVVDADFAVVLWVLAGFLGRLFGEVVVMVVVVEFPVTVVMVVLMAVGGAGALDGDEFCFPGGGGFDVEASRHGVVGWESRCRCAVLGTQLECELGDSAGRWRGVSCKLVMLFVCRCHRIPVVCIWMPGAIGILLIWESRRYLALLIS